MATPKLRSKSLENIYGNGNHRAVHFEIASVKKQIKLVEGIRRANYEHNEEELKKNDLRIEELRRQISATKKELEDARKTSGNFNNIVAAQLKKGDKIANIFKGKSYTECYEILESLIGDAKNRYNLAKYKQREMKRQLKTILQEEVHLERALGGTNKNIQPMLKELREAENNTALMEMRITEAENIQAKYKIMLETIKNENYTKANSIRTMEQTILTQKKEKLKLKEVLAEALKARTAARVKLTEAEEETLKEVNVREDKLLEARQALQLTRERMEEIGSQLSYTKFQLAHRDSSLTDGIYFFGSGKGQEEVKRECVIEHVYQKLAEMTGESNPATIVKRFEEQRANSAELERTEAELKSRVRKEKLRKRFLEDKLTQLQYSGGVKREILDKQIAELNDSISTTETRKTVSQERTQQLKDILEETMKKLSQVCTRHQIPIPEVVGPKETVIGDRVHATLQMLYGKVESILLEDEREHENVFIFPNNQAESPESDSIFPTFSYGSSADLNLLDNSNLPGVRSRRASVSSMTGIDKGLLLSPGRGGPRSRSVSRARSSSGPRERDQSSVSGVTILTKRSVSSDDEEAASRRSIKQRSQQIVEAKTKKSRYKTSTPVTAHTSRK